MKIAKSSIPTLICFLVIALSACQEEQRESPTRGSLTIITSEDIFPVIDLQVKDFSRVYEEVKITHLASSTRDAIVQLLNDSVKLIVSPREFNDEEKKVIAENDLDVSTTKIAYDAIAVIVNKKNGLEKITVADLKRILTGDMKRWTDVKGSNLSSAIIIAMGDANSGVQEYLRTRIAGSADLSTAMLPCATTDEILSVVSSRPNAIGFVGISWLTHASDNIRVLDIGDPNFKRDSTSTVLEYFPPHQAHIYRNYYPLSRTIYIYTHKAGRGVALGFSSFAAGIEGQKIIVKNGLVPATMPVRLVQLNQQ
ncbi:MAG: substrate-binding domain-containing protein [Ignavibacteriales bacterium]|nr:substrate-binding domain-containing protein [Ignavibacteriales bacterium]